jgi:hypothetical protein
MPSEAGERAIKESIVQLLDVRGIVRGCGLLVDSEHVVTCAHVAASAISTAARDQPEAPAGIVRLVFPYVKPATEIPARIVVWKPVTETAPADLLDDVAVLKLNAPAPSAAVPHGMLVESDWAGRPYMAHGFPELDPKGVWADGTFKGEIVSGWVQMLSSDGADLQVDHGFSGGGVWDVERRHFAGIMVANKKRGSQLKPVSYMIPAGLLKQARSDLPVARARERGGPPDVDARGNPHRAVPRRLLALPFAAALLAPFIALLVAMLATAQFGIRLAVLMGCIVLLLLVATVFLITSLVRPRAFFSAEIWRYGLAGLFACAFLGSARPLREAFVRCVIGALQRSGLEVLPRAADEYLWPYFIYLCVTALALAVAYVVHRRRTITPPAEPSASPGNYPSGADRDSADALRRYCGALIDYLNAYDRAVNWSDRDYTPLEAEIEAERAGRLRPKLVANLVKAVRRDRGSPTFVLIGDPGSGKSVSLRNLVRSLVQESSQSGVVPVYINLREFPAERRVVVDELVRFAYESVREQTGRDGEAFLNGYYEGFRRSGRLFFLFDSFDELPQVLDADDQSDTHRSVCQQFDKLLTQEVRSCRALIASRPFRAPSGVQGTRLLIRQLTEAQVRQVVGARVLGRGFDAVEFVRRVFRDRPELVPLLRNPFTAELLTDFARERNGDLPRSTFEIFDAYVTSRMKTDEPLIHERLGLRADELRRGAQALAIALFQGDIGLEAEASWAAAELDKTAPGRGRDLVEGLKYTRLARVGGHRRVMLTFAHRRFAEFFAVEAMVSKGGTPPIEDIPTDSRWRDGLVMYCGVASEPERLRVAAFCWERVRAKERALTAGKLSDVGDAIHCLRFLVDAFRTAPSSLLLFRGELGLLVRRMLRSPRPLVAKLAAEAIPLADEHGQQRALLRAMASRFTWVQETAISACRSLPELRETTSNAIRGYYRSISMMEKMRRFGDLNFSLSLSRAFWPLRLALWGDILEIALLAMLTAGTVLYIAIAWTSYLLVACLFPLQALIMHRRVLRKSTRIFAFTSSSIRRVLTATRPTGSADGASGETSQRPAGVARAPSVMRWLRSLAPPSVGRMTPLRGTACVPLGTYSDNVRRTLMGFGCGLALVGSLLSPHRSDAAKAHIRDHISLNIFAISSDIAALVVPSHNDRPRQSAQDANWPAPTARTVMLLGLGIAMFAFLGWENVAALARPLWPENWIGLIAAARRYRVLIAEVLILFLWTCGGFILFGFIAWALFAAGYGVIVVLAILAGLGFFGVHITSGLVLTIWETYHDRRVLARGIPERVTEHQVFDVLMELRSGPGRREYLQALLFRRAPRALPDSAPAVPGLIREPPEAVRRAFASDRAVAEDWAKLQEFWLGLSR